ncbi:hypothetical protein BV898_05547 [Hypsibius exemplaris]|uniref:Autophagy-related protein 13 n=1 Tax=Hypsibius exemplaris TaxID=2072580 RepID=A0A1W0WZG9_HYPEX|nr:hypothetical protein BV898_05547 [Hypsibius exemplaris]
MTSLKSPTTPTKSFMATAAAAATAKAEDSAELEKYLAVLATKAATIITATRSSGGRLTSNCNPQPATADWFGLAIHEPASIRTEVKELTRDHIPVIDKAFGVQVSAVLPTHELIPLEYWWLWFDAAAVEKDAHIRSTVYNRMTILLKSIIVVLRASPVNSLIRQNDYFKFTHKMFVGDPDVRNLQSVAKTFKIGPLKTPYGAVYFSGACRETAFSEGSLVSHPLNEQLPRELTPRRSVSETSNIPVRLGVSNKMGERNSSASPGHSPLLDSRRPSETGSPRQIRFAPTGGPAHLIEAPPPKTFAEMQYTGAFASPCKSASESDDETYEIPDRAFADLVSYPDDDDFGSPRYPVQELLKATRPKSILKDVPSKATTSDETTAGRSDGMSPKSAKVSLLAQLSRMDDDDDGFEEDGDLDGYSVRPAFAPPKSQVGSHDLAAFYHQCQAAPNSLKFLEKKGVTVSRTVKSLSQKLVGMESELLEFDKFVDDLRVVGGESSWIMTSSP